MESNNLQLYHIKDNVMLLRRTLRLSQGEFIKAYLSTNGTASISVAGYSNFERKGINDEEIGRAIAKAFQIDFSMLTLPSDHFAQNLTLIIGNQGKEQSVDSNSQVEQLVQNISDDISESLVNGELRPGDKIPSDRDLATTYQVGRTAIREALKVLSVLGLLDIRPGQGTFICKNNSKFFMLPLSWGFFLGDQNVEDIIQVRNVLEVESAQLAAKHASIEELAHLTAIFQQSNEAFAKGDFKAFLDLDMDFHLAIAHCSNNPIIHSLLSTSRNLIRQISKSGMITMENLKNIYQEHGIIYDAIQNKDPYEASRKMMSHLINSCARYQINK